MKRISILFAIVLLLPLVGRAQNEKLQAAFTYQFTKLLEWDAGMKSGNFKIAIIGANSNIFKELVKMNGRTVGSQSIEVVEVPSASAAGRCHVLYIPSSANASALGQAGGTNCTLVISERAGDYQRGACISFNEAGGKLNFEVNTGELKKRGFKYSETLVKLAKSNI